jgi:hypothetical protein
VGIKRTGRRKTSGDYNVPGKDEGETGKRSMLVISAGMAALSLDEGPKSKPRKVHLKIQEGAFAI